MSKTQLDAVSYQLTDAQIDKVAALVKMDNKKRSFETLLGFIFDNGCRGVLHAFEHALEAKNPEYIVKRMSKNPDQLAALLAAIEELKAAK